MPLHEVYVFISHAHDERELADALKTLIEDVSQGAISVWFSSDIRSSGGIDAGKRWRQDLRGHLDKSNFILAVQTPSSAGRPWIMWECGLASGIEAERGIIPVVYGMERGELSNPLTSYKVYSGEEREQMKELCKRLVDKTGLEARPSALKEPLEAYMESVELHRPRRALRREQMELWRDRFEELIQTGRETEIPGQREMMYASFGEPFQPIEPSVHETLSRVLLDLEEYEDTIEEVNYALSLVDSDIQLLHRKAIALLEKGNREKASSLVERLYSLNERLRRNPEIAGLEGRIYREKWQVSREPKDLEAAIEAYLRAYEADRRQYYPGINAASLLLTADNSEKAERIYKQVLETCKGARERSTTISFWVDFTEGEALLGLEKEEDAIKAYQQGIERNPAPARREKKSALRGVQRVTEARSISDRTVEKLKSLLS